METTPCIGTKRSADSLEDGIRNEEARGEADKATSSNGPNHAKRPKSDWLQVYNRLEAECYPAFCTCSISTTTLQLWMDKLVMDGVSANGDRASEESLMMYMNFLTWLGRSAHTQLLTGQICSAIRRLVNYFLSEPKHYNMVLSSLKASDPYMKYSAASALISLIPLGVCGQDIALDISEKFVKDLVGRLFPTNHRKAGPRLAGSAARDLGSTSRDHSLPMRGGSCFVEPSGGPLTPPHAEDRLSPPVGLANYSARFGSSRRPTSSLDLLTAGESVGIAGLDDDEPLAVPVGDLPGNPNGPILLRGADPNNAHQGETLYGGRSQSIEDHVWLLSILTGLVTHGGKQREEGECELDSGPKGNTCEKAALEDEQLCQETQVKCLIIRALEPVWQQFVNKLHTLLGELACSASGSSSTAACCERVEYLTDGFRLWQSLISVRANLNFIECRSFSGNLDTFLHGLQISTPPRVWSAILDTMSDCLCYGSTLGLQSIPPEEPCRLAHTFIRLVRFEDFLDKVPFNKSVGFGGSASLERPSEGSYNKSIVQKIVLITLKSVALTTREARADSSSGESDSSLSSRESGSSCNSDIIIIERNMVGVFKQLDKWIKSFLPLLPQASLQHSILRLLQEQDDVLVEGLLCLLDTFLTLHVPARESANSDLDINPTQGFLQFLSIVSRDSSVLLDFLVSNETCFLLYLLRYLKFILKDWSDFVKMCGNSYEETVTTLLQLKNSISRLMSKSLFPYNISPVLKLLEKVQVHVADMKI